MYVKHEVMICISMLVICNMIDLIMCGNKRIKIYVPEHIKHVHHHHVKKIPIYIVTKDKPRVMHASNIENDFEEPAYRMIPTIPKAYPDHEDLSIQGIYRGDNHVHEDIDDNQGKYVVSSDPLNVKKPYKLPYISISPNRKQQNFMLQHTGLVRHYNNQLI